MGLRGAAMALALYLMDSNSTSRRTSADWSRSRSFWRSAAVGGAGGAALSVRMASAFSMRAARMASRALLAASTRSSHAVGLGGALNLGGAGSASARSVRSMRTGAAMAAMVLVVLGGVVGLRLLFATTEVDAGNF